MTDKAFIDRIWSIIRDVGTQSALAEKIGTSQGTVADWVNRGSFPSTKHLANLKEKLNININWLITGQGSRYIESRVGYAHHVAEEMAEYGPRRYPADIEFVADVLNDLQLKDKQRFESAKKAIDGLLEACAKDSIESIEAKKMPRSKSKKAAA